MIIKGSLSHTVRRTIVGTIMALAVIICALALPSSKSVEAASDITVSFVGSGQIEGYVGTAITPYTFTLTINNGGSFQGNTAAGEDVTSWFAGICNPQNNQYRRTPVGLTVKTVNAIAAGDKTATFVISGTPWMGAKYALLNTIRESQVKSGGSSSVYVGTKDWIYFSILRNPTDANPKSSLSPSSLTITGSENTAVSSKEITFKIEGGNFIESISAGTDVSEWLRSDSYYVDYLHDYQFITALLPNGMTAKLKNAIKPGDRSATIVISGTPTHGSSDFIAIVPDKGVMATAGNAQSENGYGSLGYGTGCNDNYKYNISGTSVTPSITVDDVSIQATVGEAIPDNTITFRLHNCTLATTYAQGTDITSYFEKTNNQGIPVPALEKFGSGVHVTVIEFNEGADHFTCKISGTPTANGSCALKIRLFEYETSHIVAIRSTVGNARFAVTRPDTSPSVYISGSSFSFKTGFSIDPSEAGFEVGIMGGDSNATAGVRYKLLGTFSKDADISSYFTGLPNGVKVYASAAASDPQDMVVYFKGIPEKAGTYNVKFKAASMKYMKQTYDGSNSSSWSNDGCTTDLYSEQVLTVKVTDDSNFGYAYDYLLPESTSTLPYEEFKETAGSAAITITGRITTQKQVIVEGGTPRIENRSSYTVTDNTFRIYLPKITFTEAYKDGADITDIVRLSTDGPLSGCKIRLDAEGGIKAGTYYGKTLTVFLSHERTVASSSTDAIKLQVFDGSSWKNVVMPTGSNYEINEVIDGNADPDTNKVKGLSATIADCSINGIAWYMLQDREGVEITISGAQFTVNAARKYHDVTSWFTNLPKNTVAMVSETVTDSVKTTVKIVFAERKPSGVTYSTPQEVSTDPIRVTIPFADITTLNGSTAPWSNMNGGVATTLNNNAVWNIIEASTFAHTDKPMIVANTMTGVYSSGSGIGNSVFNLYVYIPAGLYSTLLTDAETESAKLQAYAQEHPEDVHDEQLADAAKPKLRLKLTAENGLFTNINFDPGYIELNGIGIKEVTNSSTSSGDKIYYVYASLYLGEISASKIASGEFTVSLITGYDESQTVTDLTGKNTHVKYKILNKLPDPVAEDEEEEYAGHDGSGNGESGNGGSGSSESTEPSTQPDIWVNGKDNKKEETYHKTMTKELSSLIATLPEGCKYIVSVTDTEVDDVVNAFGTGGKGKKSDVAKPSVKAKDGIVSVAAGKTAGVARIWVAAYNSKAKKIEASGYFDVTVGTAPKKLYLTADSKAEKTAAIKSIMLNNGDTETVFVNADGTGLSSYASFAWEAPKDTDGLLSISPSNGTAQSATIGLKSVPTDGKVKKIAVSAINNESGKKVSFSVIISNAVKEVTGLSKTYQLDSAAEAAVEATLDYSLVCYSSTGTTTDTTTDKIKVYVTTALEEGTGYSLTKNNTKFTQSGSKSKVKVTYKNGEFTLKAPKKTNVGTKVRVLIVATHADKSIDVFESGVITIGTAAAEGNN